MNLEKDIVREIKKLIVFTAIIFLCIWKYEVVFQSIHWILDVITPFLIGGAIYNRNSCKLHREKIIKEKKMDRKICKIH